MQTNLILIYSYYDDKHCVFAKVVEGTDEQAYILQTSRFSIKK